MSFRLGQIVFYTGFVYDKEDIRKWRIVIRVGEIIRINKKIGLLKENVNYVVRTPFLKIDTREQWLIPQKTEVKEKDQLSSSLGDAIIIANRYSDEKLKEEIKESRYYIDTSISICKQFLKK